jgi:hypothetical protein
VASAAWRRARKAERDEACASANYERDRRVQAEERRAPPSRRSTRSPTAPTSPVPARGTARYQRQSDQQSGPLSREGPAIVRRCSLPTRRLFGRAAVPLLKAVSIKSKKWRYSIAPKSARRRTVRQTPRLRSEHVEWDDHVCPALMPRHPMDLQDVLRTLDGRLCFLVTPTTRIFNISRIRPGSSWRVIAQYRDFEGQPRQVEPTGNRRFARPRPKRASCRTPRAR